MAQVRAIYVSIRRISAGKGAAVQKDLACPNRIRKFRYGLEARAPLAFGICLDRK
jgi:hypothetical protein